MIWECLEIVKWLFYSCDVSEELSEIFLSVLGNESSITDLWEIYNSPIFICNIANWIYYFALFAVHHNKDLKLKKKIPPPRNQSIQWFLLLKETWYLNKSDVSNVR